CATGTASAGSSSTAVNRSTARQRFASARETVQSTKSSVQVKVPEISPLNRINTYDFLVTSTRLAIPFNRPNLAGSENRYLAEAIAAGPLAGDGPFTKRATALLRELLDAPAALLTTSCTHALDMAALLLDLRPGDEVVLPSFTFCSTANAFVLR